MHGACAFTDISSGSTWETDLIRYYGSLAKVYDSLYLDKLSQDEDRAMAGMLAGRGPRIIDLGCGTGLALRLMPGYGGFYLGIDICPRMIQLTRRYEDQRRRFVVGDMHDLPVADRVATDVVSLFGPLSHCRNPERAIAEAWRILEPGGRVLMTAYSRYTLRRLLRLRVRRTSRYRIRNTEGFDSSIPTRFFSPRELETLFRRHFVDVRVTGLTTLAQLSPSWGITRADEWLATAWPAIAHTLIVEGRKDA